MIAPEPVIAAERLIVALDVDSVAEARNIVEELKGLVSFYKVGIGLSWDREFLTFVRDLLHDGYQVFLDYKYGDIGSTLHRGIAGAVGLGVNFLTIQGAGEVGANDLRYAATARDKRLKIFLVTILTSLEQEDLDASGIHERLEDRVVRRALIAKSVGLDGVIASGQEAAAIRKATGAGFLIVTPGIRPAGTPRDDQKRVSTPYEAIVNGADYLVVGRPIIKSETQCKAARGIIDDMRAAFDSRP